MFSNEEIEFYRDKCCVVYNDKTGEKPLTYIHVFEDYDEAQAYKKKLDKTKDFACLAFCNTKYFYNVEAIELFLETYKDAIKKFSVSANKLH
mgnify:CR=1 FL=1|tara:strand:- start:425 stop:700 length:276 start_codon:yes stop_codon:yes gene_type:complete